MAGADYYSCDICNCKTFYDAVLRYDWRGVDSERRSWSRETGKRWPNGNVGYMLVLCRECAEKFAVTIAPIEAKP